MISKKILMKKVEEKMIEVGVLSPESGIRDGYEDGLSQAFDIINGFPEDITYCEALERIDWIRPTWKNVEKRNTYGEGIRVGRNKAADEVAELLKETEGEEQ